ncbi:MAG: T6SS effector amidase Tae4 family protein [Candidatus Thiodiazotropha endolucinida]
MDFDDLWDSYPLEYNPCKLDNGDPSFPNQCAIRFGIALADGGINTSSFLGVHCWHGHGRRHLLRGEEIAAWMKNHPAIFGRVEIKNDVDADVYSGRRGLMFCRNFWGPGTQGDHIDLWNRNHMQTGDPNYISRSAEIWFWEIDSSSQGIITNKTNIRKKKKKKKVNNGLNK